MDIHQRLEIFYERLRSAPAASNAEEAFRLICYTLEKVEDEFCAVPKKNPPSLSFDGRMYLPQSDNIKKGDGDAMWIKTRHHLISIKAEGSFVIFRQMPKKTLLAEYQKAGANG
jgi:hypothetical protein